MGDDDRYNRVRDLLLAHADRPPNFWPWLQELNGAPADVKSANKFFVACTVDYQQNAKKAWANVRHWAEQTMGDPQICFTASRQLRRTNGRPKSRTMPSIGLPQDTEGSATSLSEW